MKAICTDPHSHSIWGCGSVWMWTSFTCRGCRSICYFLMGFWLKSVQSLPGSCRHTTHVLPGWWFHEPPQQIGLPWQQLGFQHCHSLSTHKQEQWDVERSRGKQNVLGERGGCLTGNDSGVTFTGNTTDETDIVENVGDNVSYCFTGMKTLTSTNRTLFTRFSCHEK